ncbi:dihydrofolate reductase family protein [Granulicoccus phenolivorans]|uniref:dihydrofolate reductase family protein n=1 Tax=Granulicoccus phenolivorans TaxID=266854 RepID=UPI000419B45F|nr:dihydrofolate reductase family protein [Granulicoccus phenolivorans]
MSDPEFRQLLPQARPITVADLPEVYAWAPGDRVRANMITSLDGSVTGSDGLSGSLNDAADHAVFATLRSLSDVILMGAGTVRAEHYGVPDGPRLVIVSGRGRFPEHLLPLLPEHPGQVVLVTTEAAAVSDQVRDLVEVWRVGADRVDLPGVLDRLAGQRVLTEGGPTLLGHLIAADLVDELCHTISPRLTGVPVPLLGSTAVPRRLTLRTMISSGSTLLGRWALASR